MSLESTIDLFSEFLRGRENILRSYNDTANTLSIDISTMKDEAGEFVIEWETLKQKAEEFKKLEGELTDAKETINKQKKNIEDLKEESINKEQEFKAGIEEQKEAVKKLSVKLQTASGNEKEGLLNKINKQSESIKNQKKELANNIKKERKKLGSKTIHQEVILVENSIQFLTQMLKDFNNLEAATPLEYRWKKFCSDGIINLKSTISPEIIRCYKSEIHSTSLNKEPLRVLNSEINTLPDSLKMSFHDLVSLYMGLETAGNNNIRR